MASTSILGICGSLRRDSYNLGALRTAAEFLPQGTTLTITRLDAIPLFNQDVETQGYPEPVLRLAQEIIDADAVLIASPEYNFSISGVLKNTLDWMSRLKPQPFHDKPVALMSATMGPVGGARHQYELRKVLGCLEALVMPKPEVFVNLCQPKFDAGNRLVDVAARKAVEDQMMAFGRWTNRMLGR